MFDLNAMGGAEGVKSMFQDPQKYELLLNKLAAVGPPPQIKPAQQTGVGPALAPAQPTPPVQANAVGSALGGY